ncbi:MAG: SCO family protein [Rhodocyclaceae bacterium]|nr:SCO family protein [Rhodocyclaceae bacterium]
MKCRVACASAGLIVGCLFWSPPGYGEHDLSVGETREIIPRYLLQDANGRAVMTEDFRGYFQLLSFGYTHCPDVCPMTLAEMAAVLAELGEAAQRVKPLFITLDPARDTARVLVEYVRFFDPRIIPLRGSEALVARAAQNFKVRFQKVPQGEGQYAIDHSAGLFVLGPEGAFVKKFAYGTKPAEIAAWLREAISQAGNPR